MSMKDSKHAIGEMPQGWAEVTIAQVCDLNPPKPAADAQPADAPVTFVPMPAVDANAGAITAPQVRPFSTVRKGFTAFRDEDVIVAKITPCFENGKAAVCRGLTNGLGFGSTEFHVLRSNGSVLPEYLYHFARRESFRRDGEQNMTGSVGQKRVPAEWLANIAIPLAPLAEQKRIVAKIDEVLTRVNAARERLAKVPTILRRFRQSILAAACSGRLTADWRPKDVFDPLDAEGSLPSTWKATTVSEVIESLKYGTSQKCEYGGNGVPVLRIPNIGDGTINRTDLKYAELERREFEQLRLRVGDVLMIRSNGSVSLLGKAALVGPADEGSAYAGYLMRLRPNGEKVLPEYLNMVLGGFDVRVQIEMPARSTSGVNNINSDEVKALPINVPPLDEQAEIVRRMENVQSFIHKIGTRVATGTMRADKLVQATLAKAFRGELVPTEAELAEHENREYETAEALLEGIRQQRSADTVVVTPRRSRRTSVTTPSSNQQQETLFDQAVIPTNRSGRASAATAASRATIESSELAEGPQRGSSDDWVTISYDDAMGFVREAFSEGGPREREQAIRDVAVALGYERVGSRVRETVDGYLRAAVRRGIVVNENGQYALVVRSGSDYPRDHLVERLIASMNSGWMERDEAVRATAKHLGFQRAGSAFAESMKSAINGAIRRGLVKYEGNMIRKA